MVVEHRLEDPTEMSQNAADFATFDAFPESLSKELAHVEGGDDAAQVSKDSQLANGVHVAQPEGSTISHEAGISSQDEKLPDDVQDAHVIKTPVDEKTGRKSYQSVPGSVSGKSRDNRNASYKERSPTRTSIVGDVLQSIAAGDDEGRSRHRILAFAAKRYASAVEKNPQDSDALYNWALVLQESADSLENEAGPAEKDALLDEACKKYEAATKFCPTLHEAYYNWGIAISDRAKIRGRTKEAEELWKQACQKYDRSVQLNWTSPQALNNWGLALQELGAIVPLKEKRAIVKTAIRKFRAAIRLRFDFHRAVYNLGTVLYGLAEDTLRSGRRSSTQEGSSSDLYSSSAVYIAAAHSLKPDYPVYRSALRLVRSMLPLPYLKVGYLTVPPNGNSLAPHSNWKRLWFVLDHEALYQTEKLDQKWPASSPASESGTSAGSSQSRVEVQDISCVSPTADLSLPPGGAFVVDTPAGQHFMVADNWDAVDSWVDAIRLVYTIFVRGRTDALASVLSG